MNTFTRTIDCKLILAILATGIMSFTGVVIETAMNVTFPTLMQEFQVSIALVQWITTGYLLVLAIIIPISPFLKQRFRSKQLFLTAIGLFLLGTIMGAAAPAFSLLFLGRILQGIGTGIALPLMFNIVLEQTPFDKLGLMMGIATLVTALAPAIGPSVGGFIVKLYGWRMIFISLLPLLVASLVLGSYAIRQVTEPKRTSLDYRGWLLLAGSFSCLVLALSLAGSTGWFAPLVDALLAASLIFLFLFTRQEKAHPKPLLRLQVFSSPTFAYSVAALVLLQFICLGLGFLIPNFSQIVQKQDPFTAGCILLPGCLLGAVLAPLSGKLLDCVGATKPLLGGSFCLLLATLGFAILLPYVSTKLLAAIYLIFALSQGLSIGTSMTNGLQALPPELNADGNAVFTTLQQLAGAIGTSVVATLVSGHPGSLATATALGSRHAFILLACLAALELGCCIQATKKQPAQQHKSNTQASLATKQV